MAADEPERALRRALDSLKDLPVWRSEIPDGSWLWLQFGEPHLFIYEDARESRDRHLFRRLASVRGDYMLWLQFCRWQVLVRTRRRFHSGQRILSLLGAGKSLEGRKLVGCKVAMRPFTFAFEFEEATLLTEPLQDASESEPVWHLISRSSRRDLRCEASGLLHYGPWRIQRIANLRAMAIAC